MSISTESLWFNEDTMWIELSDGRTLGIPLAWLPRLLKATPAQRSRFEFSGGGSGIHWPDVDEDISLAGLLAGRGDQTRKLAKAAE
jgi:hypothetical protein